MKQKTGTTKTRGRKLEVSKLIAEGQWITGLNCLTVPCEPAKEKDKFSPRPIYLGPEGYICFFCGLNFRRYRPCAGHMGLIMNTPASCTYFERKNG